MAIQVTYRRTRRLTMRIVKSGDVHISAPIGMPKSRIEEFIEKNREWIVKAREKTLNRQQSREAFYDQLQLNTAAQKREAKNRLQALVVPMPSIICVPVISWRRTTFPPASTMPVSSLWQVPSI